MARFADIVEPTEWLDYTIENTPEKTRVFRSGLVQVSPFLSGLVAQAGREWNAPLWGDLDSTNEAQIVSDVTPLTQERLSTKQFRGIKNYRAGSWLESDLAEDLTASDPAGRILDRILNWWDRQHNRTTVALLGGAFQDAGMAADHSLDIALPAAGTVGVANRLSPDAIIEAKALLGDQLAGASSDESLSDYVILVHSRPYFNLEKADFTQTFERASDQGRRILMFGGMEVIPDDSLPVVADPNNAGVFQYTSYIAKKGSIQYGEAPAAVPFETDRDADLSTDKLYSRRRYCFHPMGMNWTSPALAAEFPTNAELSAAGSWTRVLEPNNIHLLRVVSNG
jgi:hypothetical protein